MGREWRFLAALWPTGFPVPRPLAHCADEAVIGAPYYVMELVDGVVVGDEADAAALSPEARHAASINLVRTMAALHRFDAHALSLGDPAKADTHLTRQLHRWKAQVDAVADPCGGVEIARSYARLSSAAPDLAVPGVVHGDFRLGNALIEPSTGAIQAILDWEIATVGNVLIDIGWLVASWHGPDRIDADTPESLRGFPPRADVARLYAELMDLDPEALSYFVAFNHWRIACVTSGVVARAEAGALGTPLAELAALKASVVEHVAEAERMLDGSAPGGGT